VRALNPERLVNIIERTLVSVGFRRRREPSFFKESLPNILEHRLLGVVYQDPAEPAERKPHHYAPRRLTASQKDVADTDHLIACKRGVS